MLSFITLLCIFFIILISYQILENMNYVMEGLTNNEYQPYDTNNPENVMILAQQNAGNIIVIKQQLDNLLGLNKEVQDLSNNYVSLQDQVNGLVMAQQQYATQMTGGQAPVITGATSDSTSSTTTNTTSTNPLSTINTSNFITS